MSDLEKNNKKQTGKGSKKKAAVIFTVVLVLLGAIAGLIALVSRLKRSKAKANIDVGRRASGNASGGSSNANINDAVGPRIVDKKETARKLPKRDPPAGQGTTGDILRQNMKTEGENGIKETATKQPNDALPVRRCDNLQQIVKTDGKTEVKLPNYKRPASEAVHLNNASSGPDKTGGKLPPIQPKDALPTGRSTPGGKIHQNKKAEKENDKKDNFPKQPETGSPPAGQDTFGEKIQHNQKAEQPNKVLPDDACAKLEKDLKADGIWKLSELEANFNALWTHSKKDEIETLHPELAANSVYEAYFDKFKDKISTLLKGNGPLNILNATDMMDHLAQNCKSKLDEWISSECTQTAATTVLSDQCYYMRKASIVQGLKDAFYSSDFTKFKNQYDELVSLLRSSSIDDESLNAVRLLFKDVETNASLFTEGLLNIQSTLGIQIDGIKGDNLSTRIGKLDQLKKICELLKTETDALIAKKKELTLNVVDAKNMNDPNLAKIVNVAADGMDPNDLDVPYFITQTSSDKVLEFWKAQKCKSILNDEKLKDKHTPANAILGSDTFKTSDEVADFVKNTFEGEVERLRTEVFKCVNVTPLNVTTFMENIKVLIRLHRSLENQKWAESDARNLIVDKKTDIEDVLSRLMDDRFAQGHFDEFKALAKFSTEIYCRFGRYEINTKDEFDEARRIMVVKNNFKRVADGGFTSTLLLINAELIGLGLEAIDEAAVRRILVEEYKFKELLKSDDPNHTQYKAIKSEISGELENFIGRLDGDLFCFYIKLNALKDLMNAWIDEFDAADEIEPKFNIGSYFCKFLTEKVNDLNSSIRTTIVPGYNDKMRLARNIDSEFKCEIKNLTDYTIMEEAISTFYAADNKTSYDQSTDLSIDSYFQKYKTIYNRVREPTADKYIIMSLQLADPPNNHAKTQSLNLLVYHNIVPSLAENEYKAGCSVPAVAKKAKDAIYNVIQSIRMEPHEAMVLDELKTQIIAGRKGNGLAMFWHDLIISGDGRVKFYDDLHGAKAVVVDPLIANALKNLENNYSRPKVTPELKRVYVECYEVLKNLHSNPKSFPPLS